MILCEQRGEEKRWNEVDTYTTSTRFWLRDVTYHSFETYQNWRCLFENRISRLVRLKTYPRCPINYQTLQSSSKIAHLKRTLMHKSETSSPSRLFHRIYCLHGPAIHAIIIHCRTKSARCAHCNTLTVLYTPCARFLQKI